MLHLQAYYIRKKLTHSHAHHGDPYLDEGNKGGVTPLFSGAGTMVFIPIKSSSAGASGAMVLAPA